jgi:metal-responsive CopG/Arc/MetJ family transcriptional regulator
MLYNANMKAIQVSMDDGLLARLDADEEVRRDGRSAVLRRAADLYLRQRRSRAIASAYERAYRRKDGLGREFADWEGEGSWPEP